MYEYYEYYIYGLNVTSDIGHWESGKQDLYNSVCSLHVAKSTPYSCVAAFIWT